MEEVEAGTVTGEEADSSQPGEKTQTSTEETDASANPEGGDETQEGEVEGGETGEPDKAEKRFQKLANEKRELAEKLTAQEAQIKELAAKFEQTQRQAPTTIDERALADYLTEAEYQIDSLKAEGKTLDAALLQRKVSKLLDDVETHRQKEEEWKKTATAQEQQQRAAQEAIKELDSAADFFRDQKKIPADVWDKGATQWAEIRKGDPLLDRQYAEVWQRQGSVAAISFAYEHIQKANAAETEKLKVEKAKKDAGKVNITGTGAGAKAIASFDQLMGLGSKQVEAYKKNNPKHYQQLLDKHIS